MIAPTAASPRSPRPGPRARAPGPAAGRVAAPALEWARAVLSPGLLPHAHAGQVRLALRLLGA